MALIPLLLLLLSPARAQDADSSDAKFSQDVVGARNTIHFGVESAKKDLEIAPLARTSAADFNADYDRDRIRAVYPPLLQLETYDRDKDRRLFAFKEYVGQDGSVLYLALMEGLRDVWVVRPVQLALVGIPEQQLVAALQNCQGKHTAELLGFLKGLDDVFSDTDPKRAKDRIRTLDCKVLTTDEGTVAGEKKGDLKPPPEGEDGEKKGDNK